ncbi:hypothetical protein SANA_14600 [Gottschalkiaceae bacterium SANA]|nr:hypothetical protein SANA_14600 [Gottschalkiaceae bacterium SANA]
MSKQLKSKLSLLLVVLMGLVVLGGCSSTEASEAPEVIETAGYQYDGELMFTGEGVSFSIAYNDLYERVAVSREVKNVSSSGEESVNQVKGVVLGDLLQEQGLSLGDYSSMRFTAADGYAIDVPAEILAEKEIILAYEFDGQALSEKKMPLRVAIDDVRSMYYVSNLASIELFSDSTEEAVVESSDRKIVWIETASQGLEQEIYTYYENEDQAIMVKDLLTAHVDADYSKVEFVASDGFEKTESADVADQAYLKVTGEDAPLFTGIDLPKGMNVKSIAFMDVANVTFVSAQQAMVLLGQATVGDDLGVSLGQIIEKSGLEGDFFTLTANDGYGVEVPKEAIKDGVVYVNNDGTNTVKFNGDYPKNTKIKNLLSIVSSDGANAIVIETAESETAPEASEAVVESGEWAIEFDGLSDGAFTFTSDKAERKLTRVALHTERMKNDVVKANDWEGYKLIDILDFLHVENYTELTIASLDGYEVVLMANQVDDETLLAVVQDGQVMSEPDNRVQLVQNTEFSTTWVKGVAKITVK